MTETIYAKGMFVKEQPTQYGNLKKISIKVDDFIEFLSEHVNDNGYVNIDIMDGKKGPYAKLNTWVKK